MPNKIVNKFPLDQVQRVKAGVTLFLGEDNQVWCVDMYQNYCLFSQIFSSGSGGVFFNPTQFSGAGTLGDPINYTLNSGGGVTYDAGTSTLGLGGVMGQQSIQFKDGSSSLYFAREGGLNTFGVTYNGVQFFNPDSGNSLDGVLISRGSVGGYVQTASFSGMEYIDGTLALGGDITLPVIWNMDNPVTFSQTADSTPLTFLATGRPFLLNLNSDTEINITSNATTVFIVDSTAIFSYSLNGLIINSASAGTILTSDVNGVVVGTTVSNGITYDSTDKTLKLGGQLTGVTSIDMNGNSFTFIGDGSGLFNLQNNTVNGSIGQTFTGGASPSSNFAFVNAASVTGFQFRFSGTSVGSYNATSWTFAQRATFSNGFNVANAINNGIGTASSDSRLMILGNTAGAGSSEKLLRLANSTGDSLLALGTGQLTATQYTNFGNNTTIESYNGLVVTSTIALGASATSKTYTGIFSNVTISGGAAGTSGTFNYFSGGIAGATSPQFAVFTQLSTGTATDGQMYLGNSAGTRRITFSVSTTNSEATIGNTSLTRTIFNQTEVRFDLGGNSVGSVTSANSVNGFLALSNGASPTGTASQVGSFNIAWRGTGWNGSTSVATWFNTRVVADTTANLGRWLRMYGGAGSNLTETGTSALSIYYGGSSERYFGILKDSPVATLHIGASATNVPQIILDSTTVTGTPTNGSMWFDGTNFKGVTGGTVKTFTLA